MSLTVWLTLFHIFCTKVAYDPAPDGVGSLLTGLPGSSSSSANRADVGGGWRGVFRSVVRGVAADVRDEVVAELSEMNSVERRYMATDNSADRIQVKE